MDQVIPAAAPASAYAGFRRRFLASLLDGLIVGLISVPLLMAVGFLLGNTPLTPTGFIIQAVSFLFSSAYYVYFIGGRGQTPGKMLLKIKVIKLNTDSHPDYLHAFLREVIGKSLSALLALSYLWMLWDKRKQTWHDKLAGTVVVRV